MILTPFIDSLREAGDTGATGLPLLSSNLPPKQAPMFWYQSASPGYAGFPNYTKMVAGVDPTNINSGVNCFKVSCTGPLYSAFALPPPFDAFNPSSFTPAIAQWTPAQYASHLDSYIVNTGSSLVLPPTGSLPGVPVHFCTSQNNGRFTWSGSGVMNARNNWASNGVCQVVLARYRGTTNPDSDGYWKLTFMWSGTLTQTGADPSKTVSGSVYSVWTKASNASRVDSPCGSLAFVSHSSDTATSTITDTLASVSINYITP